MDKLDAMNAFAKVVAAGSYAEAARRMGLTRSAVSKAVMELEQLLGARLLDRTTRRVTPTEAGRAYYERCVAILADVEETEIQISRLHDAPRGVLKINAPMSFGTRYLGVAVADFTGSYPELKIELILNDRVIDPLEEGVDVTVRIGVLSDSSLIARRLAPARLVLVASPHYLAQAGTPETPEDLAHHRCLTYGHMAATQRWTLMREGAAVTAPVDFAPVLQQRRRAARGGSERQRHYQPTNVSCWPRHRRGTAAGRVGRYPAGPARHLCALCAQPLPRRQDARVHRLPS